MYEPPIMMKIKSEMDARLFRAVVEAGVTVDKEELLKALAYDRGQYEKGYEDGKRDAVLTIERDRYNEGYAKGTQDAMEIMVARASGDTGSCPLFLTLDGVARKGTGHDG